LREAVIISAVRTPIGRYMGVLKDVQPYDLGALVLNEAIKRAKVDPSSVDEVILGQAYQIQEFQLPCFMRCAGVMPAMGWSVSVVAED